MTKTNKNHYRLFGSFGKRLSSLLLAGLMALNIACSPTSGSDTGDVVISLTDAEGDFLTYAVDVTSLELIRRDDTVVSSLPETTTIDFAQYVEVTEFLTAATVPSGVYKTARLTLDFSQSNITIQDENGNAIAATAVDTDGNALMQTTVDIELNGGSTFRVAPGIPAHFTIDFDLESSNDVVINNGVATVTVNPVLIADTKLEEPKPHRLRGLLSSVDLTANSVDIALRPFLHKRNHNFGKLTAFTADETSYEIDGIEYTGNAGLDALAGLDRGAATVILGKFDVTTRQFNATEILAGSSVPWGNKDILHGSVISRTTDALVVHGGVVLRAAGHYEFNENISVLIDNNTSVFRQGDAGSTFSIADISVGQRVTIVGDEAITIGNDYVMDATQGVVRMRYSQVTGHINAVSPMTINTQRINGRRSAVYDFTGTGSDASTDADPANYEIDTVSLPLDQLAINDPVKVRGFPTAFATAPEDFTAKTIINVSDVIARLVVGYGVTGSDTAIISADDNGILLDLNSAGRVHHLEQAAITVDLNSFDTMPLIAVDQTQTGLFVIAQRGQIKVYNDYTEFQLALNLAIENGRLIRSVNAAGHFDPDLNQITARKINVILIAETSTSPAQ